MEKQSIFVEANGIKFHVMRKGNPSDPALIFLHGFPEFWYGWKNQIDYFGAQGFDVIVPDQRGYNLTEKPPKVSDYKIGTLAKDVIELMNTLDKKEAYLVGHDWGAAVAWELASNYPERFKKVAIVNVPHPLALKKTLTRNFGQLRRSWYMFAFQIPRLPELMASRNQFKNFAKQVRSSALDHAFTDEDMEAYIKAWSEDNAMKYMINWYRAALRFPPKINKEKIKTPLKIFWGKKDAFLIHQLAEKSLAYCENASLEYYEDATHWVAHEFPERLNKGLEDFFNT